MATEQGAGQVDRGLGRFQRAQAIGQGQQERMAPVQLLQPLHVADQLLVQTPLFQLRLELLALHPHPLGGVQRDHGHAQDPARLIAGRGVGDGEVPGFRHPGWLDDVFLVFEVDPFAAVLDPPVDRLVEGPYLRPTLAGRLPQRGRMTRPQDRLIGVVVDLDQLRTPQHDGRQRRIQHRADGDPQTRRPLRDRAERRFRPVVVAHPRGHVAMARRPSHGNISQLDSIRSAVHA